MTTKAKVLLVLGGYGLALAVASAVVVAHIAATSGPDAQAASGMYAAGDAFLFLAVFGVAAVPATAAGFYFVRPYPRFWRVLSWLGVAASLTGALAAVLYFAGRSLSAPSFLHTAAGISVLRVLVAPLVALALLLSSLFAPERRSRRILWCATAVEVVAFGCVLLAWTVLAL
jgi:hypothetical protein